MFIFIAEEEPNKETSPLESIICSPTLMAYKASEDLPPRPEASKSRKTSIIENSAKKSHPAKLAGLFAAMDLTLSAGAVSPAISQMLHNKEKTNNGNDKLNKQKSISLGSGQDALSNLTNSFSAFHSGLVGASALLPAFVTLPSTAGETQAGETQGEQTAKRVEERRHSNPATTENRINNSNDEENDSIDGSRNTLRVLSERRLSQMSTNSNIVEISGIISTGDRIKFDYTHTNTTIRGRNERVYCTTAPRPKLNHNISISEARSVSAATGLYRTIVGDLPKVLALSDEMEEQADVSADLQMYSENESENSAAIYSSDDVTITGSPPELNRQSSDEMGRTDSEASLRGSPFKINHEWSPDRVGFTENVPEFKISDRNFQNQSRGTKAALFRSSSKIRRQKQIDIDFEDEVFEAFQKQYLNFENQLDLRNTHELVRKTKSDIGNVRVVNSRRSQIPVRFAKSFDSPKDAGGTTDINGNHSTSAFISSATIELKKPFLRNEEEMEELANETNIYSYEHQNEIKTFTDTYTNSGPSSRIYSKSTNYYDSDTRQSCHWSEESVGSSKNLSSSAYVYSYSQHESNNEVNSMRYEVKVTCSPKVSWTSPSHGDPRPEKEHKENGRSGNEQSRMRRRRLSQMSKKEVGLLFIFVVGFLFATFSVWKEKHRVKLKDH